jgi:hypothetical protein
MVVMKIQYSSCSVNKRSAIMKQCGHAEKIFQYFTMMKIVMVCNLGFPASVHFVKFVSS